MLFMVIETFRPNEVRRIYQRLEARGRMAPEGLQYVDSWIDASLTRCFQLMACEDPRLLQEWIASWNDLIEFKIVPVVPSKDTVEVMRARLRADRVIE